MNYPAKQVIVVNQALRNTKGDKLRTGKWGAQIAHASLGAYKKANQEDPAFIAWDTGQFAKITLAVNSLEELMDIHEKAIQAGLNVVIIADSGYTEFGGVPTVTCIGIGPHWHEDIDKVTGHLKLF